jgi:hypothetical protein
MTTGFGYAIDYNAEIKADEAWIAHLTDYRLCALAPVFSAYIASGAKDASGHTPDFATWTLMDVMKQFPAIAPALFGFAREDLPALAMAVDMEGGWTAYYEQVTGQAFPDTAAERAPLISAGRKLWQEKIGVIDFGMGWFMTEETRVARLRKAKAALSRHKRNRSKFGG